MARTPKKSKFQVSEAMTSHFNDLKGIPIQGDHESVLALFNEMISLEKKFLQAIKSKRKLASDLYTSFAQEINWGPTVAKSKSYFRIRYDSEVKTLHRRVEKLQIKELQTYPINFKFCEFAIKFSDEFPPEVYKYFEEIKKLREEITLKYLFFTIRQVKNFKHSAPGSQTEFQDLMQIGYIALIDCVDTYVVGENSVKFHQRAMGSILGDFIQSSADESLVQMTQKEQRLLYKIRKLQKKHPDLNEDGIAALLEVDGDTVKFILRAVQPTKAFDWKRTGSGTGSSEYTSDAMASVLDIERISQLGPTDEEPELADSMVIKKDLEYKMQSCYNNLNILQVKMLKLLGVITDKEIIGYVKN